MNGKRAYGRTAGDASLRLAAVAAISGRMSHAPSPMPAIFFGHGSPMNALGGRFADEWRALGQSLQRPKAILMVSAHWHIDTLAVTAMERPRTIHDFGGFPAELHAIDYPAPGSPELAERVTELLAPLGPVIADQGQWGLDHGSWSVLLHAFPEADVPVVQLSLDRRQPPAFHYQVGRLLAPLRDEGVVVAGSGDTVHNLRTARRGPGDVAPFDWAVEWDRLVKQAIGRGDHQALIDWRRLGPMADLAVPSEEHFLPLLVVLGAARSSEQPQFFTDAIELGSASMLGVRFG